MRQSKLKAAIGFILMPLVFSLFIVDRVILVFVPHVISDPIQDFFFDPRQIALALWRFVFSIACITIGIGIKILFQ